MSTLEYTLWLLTIGLMLGVVVGIAISDLFLPRLEPQHDLVRGGYLEAAKRRREMAS